MQFKIIKVILLIFLFNSCKTNQENKYPETVLGIKLGKPIQPQYDSLLNIGKLILTVEGIKFIDFGRYKGSLMEHTFNDGKTLRWLTVLYVDPNNRGILTDDNTKKGVLDEYEKNEII